MTHHRTQLARSLAVFSLLVSFGAGLAASWGSAGAQEKDKKSDKKDDKKEEKKEPPKLDTPKQVLKDHKGWVHAVAYNHDGSQLATSSRDRTVKIWDLKEGKPIQTLKMQPEKAKGVREVKSVVFLGTSTRVAVPTGKWNAKQQQWEGELKIFDGGKEVKSLPGHSEIIEAVAASADGKKLASAAEDKLIKIWDVENGKDLHTLKGHAGPVLAVALSRDGKLLASAGEDSAVILWNAETGKEIAVLKAAKKEPEKKDDKKKDDKKRDDKKKDDKKDDKKPEKKDEPLARPMTSVAFNTDGTRLAAGSLDGIIRIWETAPNGKELPPLKAGEGVWAVVFSPDGKKLATGGYEGVIKIWDADKGTLLREIIAYRGTVTALAFSPDGQHLASAGIDPEGKENLVKIWSMAK